MPLAFLAPLFLAGAALVAIPWIIHHIRRPEREPLRFSSLMFIPKVTREVIERRRIQHLLLMLLRMAALAALAFAFARPYWREAARPGAEGGPGFHVIALDASFSMGAPGVAEKARQLALDALSGFRPGDKTGLIIFSGTARAVVDVMDSAEEGDPAERIRAAVQAFKPGQDVTAYVPALRLAQEQLLAAMGGDEDEQAPRPRAVVHLVSDFQKSGLPKDKAGWRLSPRIRLACLDAGTDGIVNDAVTAVHARRTSDGKLRIQARVRNGSPVGERTLETRLFTGDTPVHTERPLIKPLNASQVSFTLPLDGARRVEGRVETGDDPLAPDNVRYFTWSEAEKKRVTCISDTESEGGFPSAQLLERAVPHGADDAWIWERRPGADLPAILAAGAARPDVILLSEPGDAEGNTDGLLNHIREGGRLWVMLRAEQNEPTGGLKALLGELGVIARGPGVKGAGGAFRLLSWTDFEHPVFTPLRGERFNDFSQVRFFNFQKLETSPESTARVMARFEAGEDGVEFPAMIEAALGGGSVVVWAFSPDLGVTNFARTIKFVPVVIETLNHLTGAGEGATDWFVGQRYTRAIAPPAANAAWRVEIPGGEPRTLDPSALAAWEPPVLDAAGFMRAGPADSGEWRTVEAVNVRPEESNLERMAVEDFKLRLASPDEGESAWAESASETEKVAAGYLVRREYSRWLLAALFGLLLLECWYAPRVLR